MIHSRGFHPGTEIKKETHTKIIFNFQFCVETHIGHFKISIIRNGGPWKKLCKDTIDKNIGITVAEFCIVFFVPCNEVEREGGIQAYRKNGRG